MQEDILFKAMMFARSKHKNHVRKYTNTPYIEHLAEVAALVATVDNSVTAMATAWLHDSVEDCGVTEEELQVQFGDFITIGVMELSDLEIGNRAYRKEQSRKRLGNTYAWVQTIKCCDLISNTKSIVQHDPNFAVVYLQEKRQLLAVLTDADQRMWNLAYNHLIEGQKQLVNLGYTLRS